MGIPDIGRLTEDQVYELMRECWITLTEEKQYKFLKDEVGKATLEEAAESCEER